MDESAPPLLIPKEESRIYSPENQGYVRPGSNLLPKNSGYVATCGYALQGYIPNRTEKYGLRTMAALCFGNGYSGERLIRE